MTQRRPPKPAHLEAAGRGLWRQVTGAYDLRPYELLVLEAACFTSDLIAPMRGEMAGSPLLLNGSMDQPRPRPLLVEIRQQRLALSSMLKQLRLPDVDDDPRRQTQAAMRSVHARQAAHSRWQHNPAGIGRGPAYTGSASCAACAPRLAVSGPWHHDQRPPSNRGSK